MKLKVVVCGPPHSGKSVFLGKLKTALRQKGFWLFIFRANPDGEGDWFLTTAERSVEDAMSLRSRTKKDFSGEFVKYCVESLRGLSLPLVAIDVGGRISEENATIMSEATHAIILSCNEEAISQWEGFCQELGLKVLAKLRSSIDGEDIVGKTVTDLNRGSSKITPSIEWIADLLLSMTT